MHVASSRAPYHHDRPPCFAHPRRLFGRKLRAAKEEMEAEGIRIRTETPWATPLHVVVEPCEGLRAFGDYRELKKLTVLDRYPPPRIDDITSTFKGAKFSR